MAARQISPEQIRQAFAPYTVSLTVHSVEGGQIEQAAREAAGCDAEIVVAAGGDGTVSAVAAALVDTDKTLGVLPLGTLNHFAKSLGLPLDLAPAAAVICQGSIRSVDVGEVNSHIFINNSSIGVYPAVVRNRDQQRHRLGRNKWLALFLASIRIFRRFPLLNVHLQTDKQEMTRRTPFVFVGNNDYQIGLLTLGKRPCLDGGQLSLYVANCTTRWAILQLAWRTLLGKLKQGTDFDILCPKELTVQTGKHRISVALDGEVLHLQPPLNYRIRPLALRVIS